MLIRPLVRFAALAGALLTVLAVTGCSSLSRPDFISIAPEPIAMAKVAPPPPAAAAHPSAPSGGAAPAGTG